MVIILTTMAVLAVGAITGGTYLAYKGGKAVIESRRDRNNGGYRQESGGYPTT